MLIAAAAAAFKTIGGSIVREIGVGLSRTLK